MSKNTYWLADPEGTLAPVEGVDERDRLVRLDGWTEAAEPDRHDFVWLTNEDPALGAARMTWEAAQLDAWAGRGWTPGLPLAGGGVVDEPVVTAPAKSSPIKASAASGDKKE
jgi:hypothetical protein